jgi:plasmid stabilization system protein ParE
LADRYHVIILPRAFDDIFAICAYIERDSPQNAASVAQRILDSIDSLDFLPRRYRVHEHRSDPAKTVHAMPMPPFIIYYRIDELPRAVRILAVVHGSRRQPRRFK